MKYTLYDNNINDIMSTIQPQCLMKIKEWIYNVCEKIAPTHMEARLLAYHSILWLEYLILNKFPLSKPLDHQYIQLYALIILDTIIDKFEHLRKICSSKALIDLTNNVYSLQDVYKLSYEIQTLDLHNLIVIESIFVELEKTFNKLKNNGIEISDEKKKVIIVLIDGFILKLFTITSVKLKIISACIAVTNFWISEKEEEKWPLIYSNVIGLQLKDFIEEYDKAYCVAYFINMKNLEKKNAARNNQ